MASHLVFLISLTFLAVVECELEAILTNARLPFPTASITSIYDGDDSIYLFGGLSGNTTLHDAIHRYEISTDTFFPSIASLPSGRYSGGISSDSSGNIFYYGSFNLEDIFKFDPNDNSLTEYAQLESLFVFASVVKHPDSPNIAFLVGGQWSTTGDQYVSCFNMSSATGCRQTVLQGGTKFRHNSGFVYGENAFIFGRDTGKEMLILDLNTQQSQIVPVTLPNFLSEPNVVTDGSYGYLIGGYLNTSVAPMDSLIKFDPETLTHEFIPVKNHPGHANGRILEFTSTVYVEKLNRIYIFGGRSSTSVYYEGIWYIDLPTPTGSTSPPPTETTPRESTTLDPTTTTGIPEGNCTEDGFYYVPYPGDCSKYMVCFHFDLLPEVHTCPDNMLFDPVVGECNFENLVPCEPICPNNDTLLYIPHRNNCSLYWLCFWGEIELRTCPDNTVFDPQLNNCNNKEFVFCPNLCPTDTPIANFPHESDCSKYWHCLNGTPTLITCPDGQFYNPVSGNCGTDPAQCDSF